MHEIVLIGGRRFDHFLGHRLKKNEVTYISLLNFFSWPTEVDSADTVIISGSPFLSRKFGVSINQKSYQNQLDRILPRLKPKSIFFISSAAVYGLHDTNSIPICEKRPLNPASEYAEEKCLLEQFFCKYADENSVSTFILRPAGFFSCFKNGGAESFLDRMLNLGKNEDHKFVLQNGGRQIRDFCEFNFLCDVMLALHKKKNTGETCFNVKNTNGFHLGSICNQLCNPNNLSFEIDDGSVSIHSELDISLLRSVLGDGWIRSRYFDTIEQVKAI